MGEEGRSRHFATLLINVRSVVGMRQSLPEAAQSSECGQIPAVGLCAS